MNGNPLKTAGEPDPNPKETLLESAPEAARWNPVPGSMGHKAPVAAGEDEDGEGRSDNEALVEMGVADAAQNQSDEAAKKDL